MNGVVIATNGSIMKQTSHPDFIMPCHLQQVRPVLHNAGARNHRLCQTEVCKPSRSILLLSLTMLD